MIEAELTSLFEKAIHKYTKSESVELKTIPQVIFDRPKFKEHGDLSTNIAMVIASQVKKKSHDVAKAIIENLPKKSGLIQNVEVAGPGFINITIEPSWYLEGLREIDKDAEKFGRINIGHGKKLQVEFVSANPTGPLHIGHGRGAVYGDVLGNIMKAVGYKVTKEYYVNDAGVQMLTLGRSIYLRFLELEGKKVEFPKECYQGAYIADIARELKHSSRAKLLSMKEDDAISFCSEYGGDKILEEIKQDLAETGVVHDLYFYETHLHTDAAVDRALADLKNRGYLEERDGALWFKSTGFGDDKDRVLKKSNGELTYFAADIAYHKNKFDRGFERIIDIWGADHGGYVARMSAAIEAMGHPKESFNAILIQLVNLVRGGQVVSMSTRSATYETLEDVRKEVGRDACRYFFLMRSHNAQLDFDLELAKKDTSENPVFYIQYAHARIASVFRKALEAKIKPQFKSVDLKLLDLPEEIALSRMLSEYPAVIAICAETLEPHRLAFYLLELAKCFQGYYSRGRNDKRYKIISEDKKRTLAKLYLLKNCKTVIQNGLNILGISAPEEMRREEGEDV